jgi:hypothetical protein
MRMSPDDQATPDALSRLASAWIPDVIRGLPQEDLAEAIAFHSWLDERLSELRRLPLSFVDTDIPAGRVHQALARCALPRRDTSDLEGYKADGRTV